MEAGPVGQPRRPAEGSEAAPRPFIEALADEFEKHGAEAITQVRVNEPVKLLQIIASLMPKDMAVSTQRLSDEELRHAIDTIDRYLAAGAPALGSTIEGESTGGAAPDLLNVAPQSRP